MKLVVTTFASQPVCNASRAAHALHSDQLVIINLYGQYLYLHSFLSNGHPSPAAYAVCMHKQWVKGSTVFRPYSVTDVTRKKCPINTCQHFKLLGGKVFATVSHVRLHGHHFLFLQQHPPHTRPHDQISKDSTIVYINSLG
jgi:hypothetical protein